MEPCVRVRHQNEDGENQATNSSVIILSVSNQAKDTILCTSLHLLGFSTCTIKFTESIMHVFHIFPSLILLLVCPPFVRFLAFACLLHFHNFVRHYFLSPFVSRCPSEPFLSDFLFCHFTSSGLFHHEQRNKKLMTRRTLVIRTANKYRITRSSNKNYNNNAV